MTLERPLLDVFHDVYDKVLLILSSLPQSEENEIPEAAQAQTPESVIQSGIYFVSGNHGKVWFIE